MECFKITGGKRLCGSAKIQGSKNALLPIMSATVICGGKYIIDNCAQIKDVHVMCDILSSLGADISVCNDKIQIDTTGLCSCVLPDRQSKEMRSSIFLLGSVLARFQRVLCVYPGGCAIGERPIDLHLSGLQALGVKVEDTCGKIECSAKNAHPGNVHLDFPSVGATENLIMFAASLDGETIISNAAKEPEIADLQCFLRKMGVDVKGAGTPVIRVKGTRKDLRDGFTHTVMPDRIAAGTLIAATAVSGGETELCGVCSEHLSAVTSKFSEMGCRILSKCDTINVTAKCRPKAAGLTETAPYPGFPTDMQAMLFSACAVADGTSTIKESIYENRFHHAYELRKMGADMNVRGRYAVINGKKLHGARVSAKDLRGGAALTVAGLCAEGETVVEDVDKYIDRGYEHLEDTLCALGADIRRVRE